MLRAAASDLYYNSVRLVAANVVWALALLVVVYSVMRAPLLAPLLVVIVPLSVGLMGMATTLTRHGRLFWSDWTDAIRRRFVAHTALGVAQLVLAAIAIVDVLVGIRIPGLLGPIVAVVGAYSLAAIWVLSMTSWPLLLDPLRSDDGIVRTLRLGAVLAIAHPLRIGALALVIAVLMAASVVLAAALVTVSGAYAALVLARYVLPAADRLEGRATQELLD